MKLLKETFEDKDFEILKQAKGKLTWRTWLIATARSQLEERK